MKYVMQLNGRQGRGGNSYVPGKSFFRGRHFDADCFSLLSLIKCVKLVSRRQRGALLHLFFLPNLM